MWPGATFTTYVNPPVNVEGLWKGDTFTTFTDPCPGFWVLGDFLCTNMPPQRKIVPGYRRRNNKAFCQDVVVHLLLSDGVLHVLMYVIDCSRQAQEAAEGGHRCDGQRQKKRG